VVSTSASTTVTAGHVPNLARSRRVPLDRDDRGPAPGERLADQAVPGADVEHQVAVGNAGAVDERIDRAVVDEEVLAENPAPDGSVRHAPERIRER